MTFRIQNSPLEQPWSENESREIDTETGAEPTSFSHEFAVWRSLSPLYLFIEAFIFLRKRMTFHKLP